MSRIVTLAVRIVRDEMRDSRKESFETRVENFIEHFRACSSRTVENETNENLAGDVRTNIRRHTNLTAAAATALLSRIICRK